MRHRVTVEVPGAAHEVVVGTGVIDDLGTMLASLGGMAGSGDLADSGSPGDSGDPAPIRRAALVTSPAVGSRYGARVRRALESLFDVHEILMEDGEQAKSLDTLAEVYRQFAAIPLNRDDVVVALGGGVVGDLAGFAAATWNRGVRLVQVPTTLLAQVDSSVGGKTGVNVAEGKNLVGAFHQPILVATDIDTLASLPQRELLAGLAEVVKYGFISDPHILTLLDEHPTAITGGDLEVLTDLVHRSVQVKADIVSGDEREAGRRMLLNYGHTVGHAIEALTGYAQYRHGEAVGLGMIVAAAVGESMRVSQPGLTEMTIGVLTRLGLPSGGAAIDPDEVWRTVALDKKTQGGRVRMVLCSKPGEAEVVADPPRDAVDDALMRIA